MMVSPREFQLGLLPERRISWRTVATSYGLEIIFVLLLINIGLIWPQRIQLPHYRVTDLIARPALKPLEPIKIKPVLQAKLLPPPLFSAPKLVVPPEVRQDHPQVPEPEPPKVVVNNFTPPVLKVGGARPEQIVHTGQFGSSAAPTIDAPVQKVQTGGFGDPNGLPGQGKPDAHLVAMNAGSFDLPPGPGYGNGAGGANGLRGTIASAGFGSGIASPGHGDGRSSGRGSVQTGSFGAQEVAAAGSGLQRQLDSGPPTTPVQITFKPNPVYTPQAREMKLEGEVLLEVLFAADGQLHVNRVVRGLGYGLDEAAMAAANQMRFKPAARNGVPVDSTAIVHVLFQLAY